jgi:DNA-binding beta-propeller fold protein YncE
MMIMSRIGGRVFVCALAFGLAAAGEGGPPLQPSLAAASTGGPRLAFINYWNGYTSGLLELEGAIDVTLSPDGTSVYVASRDSNTLFAFSRNLATGYVSFVGKYVDNGVSIHHIEGAHSVVVSPNGKHVYVAAQNSNAVAFFSRNESTGALTFREAEWDGHDSVDGLLTATAVDVSPDGNHIYVAGYNDNAIAIFERNHTTGFMTYSDVVKDTDPGVDGLAQAYSVVVSPDNKHVYAASATDDAVAVFSRNASTGALTFVEIEKDGVGGVDGLRSATDVAVSPDGKNVYAVGSMDYALVVFSRNATTGELTYLTHYTDGCNGIDGLGGAISVAVSPQGTHVFVASYVDDALAAFSRDISTGWLELTDIRSPANTTLWPGLLDAAQAVTVSPEGNHVFVAAPSAISKGNFSQWKVSDIRTFKAEAPDDRW